MNIFSLHHKDSDLIINSPYCLLYSSVYVSWENLLLDELSIAQSIFVLILITCLLNIVQILIVRRDSVLVTLKGLEMWA